MLENVDANASAVVDIHVVDSEGRMRQRTWADWGAKIAYRVRKVILGAEKLKGRGKEVKDGTRLRGTNG